MGKIIAKDILKIEDEEHRRYHKRLLYVFIVITLLLFGGATFYHLVEGWRYLDAIYFSAYTITTVGYGDFVPKTDAGKVFTIIYVFAGVGIVLYGLSIMASHFVEVREEFWLEKLGNIRLRHHTETFWGKLKKVFGFEPGKIVKEYENSRKKN